MAEQLAVADAPAAFSKARRAWLLATVGLTLAPILTVPWVVPASTQHPAFGLGWVLFVGSSVHVASTGWFYSVGEVRSHMRAHRSRFVAAPAALIALGIWVAVVLSAREADLVLLALFGWQLVHFQKQNLGLCALAARSCGVAGPSRTERTALMTTSAGAVVAVAAHPQLLQVHGVLHLGLLFPVGAVLFTSGVVAGLALLLTRPRGQRPASYTAVYAMSLLFFAPVWLFGSPYAAIAGLTIAHGVQYLLLVGLVAGGAARGRARTVSLAVLVDVALLAGLALNKMSHLHGGDAVDRVLFGVYLGLTAAHFVTDAGLWRLRDAFPRRFLTERLPYLLVPRSG